MRTSALLAMALVPHTAGSAYAGADGASRAPLHASASRGSGKEGGLRFAPGGTAAAFAPSGVLSHRGTKHAQRGAAISSRGAFGNADEIALGSSLDKQLKRSSMKGSREGGASRPSRGLESLRATAAVKAGIRFNTKSVVERMSMAGGATRPASVTGEGLPPPPIDAAGQLDCAGTKSNALEGSGAAIDTVLKGVQVGHGIRLTVHPKTVGYQGQSALADAVKKIHDAGCSAAKDATLESHIDFTLDQIHEVREELTEHHRTTEKKLSALGQLLIERFTGGAYTPSSLVTAQVGSSGDVFTLSQNIPKSTEGGGADSQMLAEKQLSEITVEGAQPRMVDHSLDYLADEWNEFGVHRVITHSRSGEDLWMVIADSLFGLDDTMPDLKHVDEDMYRLKIVVEDGAHAAKLHRYLRNLEWSDSELQSQGIPVESATREAVLVEESTHTAQDLGHMVTLGQEATGDRTSIVDWWGAGVQIRIQTLDEDYAETEMLSMMNRERLWLRKLAHQEELASVSPLYGFTRNLVKWMLSSDCVSAPPSMEQIKVNIRA